MSLEHWLSQLTATVTFLRNPHIGILPPPTEGEPQERLQLLLRAWATLGLGDGPPTPAWAAALAGNVGGGTTELAAELRRLAGAVEDGIMAALSAGATDESVIFTASFGEVRQHGSDCFAAALWDTLAPGHSLRDRLMDGDLFRLPTGEKVLLMGRMVCPLTASKPLPRPWYFTRAALELTRERRAEQRWQENETARLDKFRRENERRTQEKLRELAEQRRRFVSRQG